MSTILDLLISGRVRLVFPLLLFAVVSFPLRAQPEQSSPRASIASFAGSWSAEFKDTPYVVLEIRNSRPVSGEIRTGSINANEDGDVSEVTQEPGPPMRLVDPKLVDRRLLFRTRAMDGELIDYEMSILEPGKASLKIDGMPIKPFVLIRAK